MRQRKVIHKRSGRLTRFASTTGTIRRCPVEEWGWPVCGQTYLLSQYTTYRWANVTCQRCLRKRATQ
jgi:hypothetical protein